jgi:hypothetical protein
MKRQLMKRSEIWYHLYPLGFLGAEERNPAPGAVDGPTAHRLRDLVGWLDIVDWAAKRTCSTSSTSATNVLCAWDSMWFLTTSGAAMLFLPT